MTKKILILGVAIIMAFGLFACGNKIPFNAVVLSDGYNFKTKFLNENRTYGARYLNENYNEDEDEWSDRYLVDETSPIFRVFVIKEQAELDKAFVYFPQIDFDKNMILVYCYTEIYSRSQIINSIELDGTVLEVEFSLKKAKPGVGDASAPQTRFMIIKMDLLAITEVTFIKK